MRITRRCGGSQVMKGPPSRGAAPAATSIPVGNCHAAVSAVMAAQTSSRSFADANRTSLSMPSAASGLPAAPAPVMRSPTSRTMRPATASSQRAERWSGCRDGSGATAARAVGEIT
ncbi:MAG: hypothetical protein JWR30_1287 [Conexibacter sp.]|nr:hypothetical protein [Conexibacter sp.]